jgi:short subunit dehydrogenase-like uncharacterized protein
MENFMNSDRTYDIIVFGATGFTGKLVAAYLAEQTGQSFRWAIAGRNSKKLQEVKRELGLGAEVGLITADSNDYASLTAMSQEARVILTTVGPYMKYGEPVVKACVETATDYVDITGEPEFVNTMIERYGEQARQQGIRMVNCCGFDSIPHDLGVYMMVQALPTDQPVVVEGFISVKGGFSGGTWHSAIEAIGRMRQQMKPAKSLREPTGRTVRGLKGKIHYQKAVKGWVVPFPTIDPQIILRSAQALPVYGDEFRYAHYIRIGALPLLIGGAVAMGAVIGLAQFKATRHLLLKLRQPGEGPSEEQRQKSHFRVTFIRRKRVVRLASAANQQLVGEVRGGDAGYTETAKMVAESALCLSLSRSHLPNQTGILTPAVAMGDLLLERLRKAGIVFELGESGVFKGLA